MLFVAFFQLCFVCNSAGNVEKGTGCIYNYIMCVLFKLCYGNKSGSVVVAPYILSVYDSRKQRFILGEAVCLYKLKGLFAFGEVKTDTVGVQSAELLIAVADISEIGLHQYLYAALVRQYLLIKRHKELYIPGSHISDQ